MRIWISLNNQYNLAIIWKFINGLTKLYLFKKLVQVQQSHCIFDGSVWSDYNDCIRVHNNYLNNLGKIGKGAGRGAIWQMYSRKIKGYFSLPSDSGDKQTDESFYYRSILFSNNSWCTFPFKFENTRYNIR